MKKEKKKPTKEERKAAKAAAKKEKMGFREVWRNFALAFGIVWKYSKIRVIYTLLNPVIEDVIFFFTGAWLTRYVFNSIQRGRGFDDVSVVVICLFALSIVWSFISLIFEIRIAKTRRFRVVKELNRRLFKKVASVDLACYEDPEFYRDFTMTVPEASGGVDDGAMGMLSEMLGTLTTFVTSASLIAVIDPLIALVALIPFFSNIIFGKKTNKLQFDYQMQMRDIKRDKDYVDRLFYLGDNAKEMRMTNIHTVLFRRFADDLKRTKAAIRKYGVRTTGWLQLVKNNIDFTLVRLLIYAYSLYKLLVTHTMPVGDFMVIVGAVMSLSWGIGNISATYIKMHQHSMFIRKMHTFMNYENKVKEPEHPAPTDTASPVIELDDVSFRYFGSDVDVLKNVSFTLNYGERIAIVGANGAGKSTLVKLMMRLYDTTDGNIKCSGEDIRDLSLEEYRDLYGVVFQDYRIFAMSVRDNVLLGRDGDDETVISALKAAGVYIGRKRARCIYWKRLTGRVYIFPKRPKTLSGC